ncbi:MAG: C39 family peptidase [Eubacteriales bacterium]|nr:C39 family peptidase [Eubacteriales bacterium]
MRRNGFIYVIMAVMLCLTFPVSAQEQNTNERRYLVQAPRELDSSGIRVRMEELAGQYPEFQEIYDNLDLYPEELLLALCNNPEMIDFVKGYPETDGKVSGGLTEEELEERIPLLIQWDTRWGYVSYGNSMIGLSGCAPVCLSMVIIAITGNEKATPDVLADDARTGGYYTPGVGTSWTFLTDVCEKYGITGKELMLDQDKIFSELKKGNFIICSMRQGDFTTAGHFIVLTETDGDRLRIYDPNCIMRSSWSWDFEVLRPQIKNLWVYSKTEPAKKDAGGYK